MKRLAAAMVLLAGVTAGCGEIHILPTGRNALALDEDATTAQSRLRINPDALVRRGVRTDLPRVDCAKARCVALTFDDGPAKGTTVRLLKILRDHHARATF